MESNCITLDYSKQKEFDFYFCSDVHSESINFDRELFLAEMNEAKNKNAIIHIGGDFWSLISPKDFKRYTASNDTISIDGLINRLLRDGEKLLTPYVDNIHFISTGNHETSYLKYHGVDITLFLVDRLNRIRSKNLPAIIYGGYSGFIRYKFKWAENGCIKKLDLFYNHGQGGTAEVTDGIIDLKRRQYVIADLIWLQHKHKKVMTTWSKLSLRNNGDVQTTKTIGFITGCFVKSSKYDINKDGYRINYGEEKMRTPVTNGGAFLKVLLSPKFTFRLTLT